MLRVLTTNEKRTQAALGERESFPEPIFSRRDIFDSNEEGAFYPLRVSLRIAHSQDVYHEAIALSDLVYAKIETKGETLSNVDERLQVEVITHTFAILMVEIALLASRLRRITHRLERLITLKSSFNKCEGEMLQDDIIFALVFLILCQQPMGYEKFKNVHNSTREEGRRTVRFLFDALRCFRNLVLEMAESAGVIIPAVPGVKAII